MHLWRLHTAQSNPGRLEPLFPLLTLHSQFNCYLHHFRWVRRSIFHENPQHVNRFVTQGSPNAPSDPKKQFKKAQDHPQHLKLKLERQQGRRKEAQGVPKGDPWHSQVASFGAHFRTCSLQFNQNLEPELCLNTIEPCFPSFTLKSRFDPYLQLFRWVGRPIFLEFFIPLNEICHPRLSQRPQRTPEASQGRPRPSTDRPKEARGVARPPKG